MTLSGKRVARIEIKSKGDAFYELWKSYPHQIPSLTPATIKNCQTLDGQVGTIGAVLVWSYIHEGKDRVVKTLVKDINEEKKLVSYEVLGGDLQELYKKFVLHIHVETHGINLVSFTVEYEKLRADVPDPDSLMDFYRKATKDIETHHLQN